jgi:hypothetical protein
MELGSTQKWTGDFVYMDGNLRITGTTSARWWPDRGSWINDVVAMMGGIKIPQAIPNCVLNVTNSSTFASDTPTSSADVKVFNIFIQTQPAVASQKAVQCLSWGRISASKLRSWQTVEDQSCPVGVAGVAYPPASTDYVNVVTYSCEASCGGGTSANGAQAVSAGGALAASLVALTAAVLL